MLARPRAGKVVTLEDGVAGVVDGTEEGKRLTVEDGGVADGGDGRTVGGASAGLWGHVGMNLVFTR